MVTNANVKIGKRILSVFLIALLMFSMVPTGVVTAFAADATHTVFVTDGNTSIAGALVTLYENEIKISEKNTDGNGEVEFSVDDTKTYTVSVTADGYDDVEKTSVSLSESKTTVKLTVQSKPEIDIIGTVRDDSNTAVKDATVHLKKDGTTIRTAITDENGYFSFASVISDSYTIVVSKEKYKSYEGSAIIGQSNDIKLVSKSEGQIKFDKQEYEVKYGQTINLICTSNSGSKVSFSSDNDSIASVDSDGVITPVSVGVVTITATTDESDNYLSASATCKVRVVKGSQNELKWNNTVPAEIPYGKNYANVVTGGNGSGVVTYSSSNEEIATVDNSGELTIKKPGQVTITAIKLADAYYEQATAQYTLNIVKADQIDLKFDSPNPDDIAVFESFKNVATGGTVEGIVTYKSSNETVATVDEEGKITAVGAGEVTVTATLAGNDCYNDVTASYKIKVNRVDQEGFAFAISSDADLTYGVAYENVASGGEGTGSVTYSSSDENIVKVDDKGVLTLLKAGKAVITAEKASDNQYKAVSVSYKVTVERADQVVEFSKEIIDAITYGETYENPATAKTAVTYSVDKEDIAKIDPTTGLVTPLKAGTVTVKATAEKTDCYNEASKTYRFTINRADRNLTFSADVNVKYNEVKHGDEINKYFNEVINNSDDKTAVFSVESGDNVSIDAKGIVTIKGAGIAEIKAVVPETECYNESVISYTIEVAKSSQTIAYEETSYSVINGTEFTEPKIKVEYEESKGEITYSIDSAPEKSPVSAIDPLTGELTFTNVTGEITVKAEIAEDENYESASTQYVLSVEGWEPTDEFYELIGEKNSEEDWFRGNVSVAADQGYEISYESDVTLADWRAYFERAVTTDNKKGEPNVLEFYVREKSTGKISTKRTVKVNKDAVTPEGYITVSELSAYQKILEFFGQKQGISVSVVSADRHSGINNIKYYIDEKNIDSVMSKAELDAIAIEDWSEYTDSYKITDDKKFVFYAKITDNADNYIYVSTNGVIFDITEANVDHKISTDISDNNVHYSSDVTVNFDVTDPEPSTGIKSIAYKVYNGDIETQSGVVKEYEVDENTKTTDLVKDFSGSITVDAEKNNSDNVKVKILVTDNAGNVAEEVVDLKICVTKPKIEVEFDKELSHVGDGLSYKYFGETVTATVKISCRPTAWISDNVKITVTQTDKFGIDITDARYIIGNNWSISANDENPDETVYSNTVTFLGDANYPSFVVSYTDSVGNKADRYSLDTDKLFCVDTGAPQATVKVDANEISELIETLTFGRFKNTSVNVSAKATDSISGVASIKYIITDETGLLSVDSLNARNDWEVWNGDLTLDADRRFTVYLKATDLSGNVSYVCSNGYILENDAAVVDLVPEDFDSNNYFNDDFRIGYKVAESGAVNSGIKSVSYHIKYGDRKVTENIELFRFDKADPKFDELVHSIDVSSEDEKAILISAKDHNRDSVTVCLEAIDNAGNKIAYEETYNICTTKPEIKVSYVDEPDVTGEYSSVKHYQTSRTAKIEIICRNSVFETVTATEGIVVTATDSKGMEVPKAYSISAWENSNGETADSSVHTAYITFLKDANYSYTINFNDYAGNSAEEFTSEKFVIDSVVPTGSITIDDKSWTGFLSLIFNNFKNTEAEVTISADDATSTIKDILYYKSDDTSLLTYEKLNALGSEDWITYSGEFVISPDERVAVYAKLVDQAGNFTYICSDGHIIENDISELEFHAQSANENGYYNDDFKIGYTVKETGVVTSGIKSIFYQVFCDGKATTEKIELYSYDIAEPTYDKLVQTVSIGADNEKAIVIDAKANNSDNVVVRLTAIDNAGNEHFIEENYRVCVTEPEIKVTYVDEPSITGETDVKHYQNARKAKIEIICRNTVFSDLAATNGIVVTAKDFNGNTVGDAYSLSKWTKSEGTKADECVHTAYITFDKDANYSFTVDYTDLAGNDALQFASERFVIDSVVPTGKITIDNKSWTGFLSLIFNNFKNYDVQVDISASDATSAIKEVYYYKTSATKLLTFEELDALDSAAWSKYIGKFDIIKSERTTVYAKIVDQAGNYNYICSGGHIVEDNASVLTLDEEKANDNGYYNEDFRIGYSVTENDIYSGIKSISYWVKCDGVITKEETVLYSFNSENPVFEDLLNVYNVKATDENAIVIDAKANDSDNVEVFLKAVDNAGNEITISETYKICVTKPVIKVEYIDEPDVMGVLDDVTYYQSTRKAKVSITCRDTAFDKKIATDGIKVIAEDLSGKTVTNTFMIGEWVTKKAENPNETVHSAIVTFSANARYSFEIEYTDKADNKAVLANDLSSNKFTSEKFVVDSQLPTGTVSIDSNIWDKFLSALTFGLWDPDSAVVSFTKDDVYSPIKTYQYFVADTTNHLAETDLVNVSWSDVPDRDSFTLNVDKTFVVYLKLVDYAGNTKIISSDGYIIDHTKSGITLKPDAVNENGYMNISKDEVGEYFNVGYSVVDSEPYSGINTVDYEVYSGGKKTQSGNLYDYNKDGTSKHLYGDLTDKVSGTIRIDAEKNNSDAVILKLISVDNAGNKSEAEEIYKVDITDPVIEIEYANNVASFEKYFKGNRVATIKVTERASEFDVIKATENIVITAHDAQGNSVAVDRNAMISGWTTYLSEVDANEDFHVATITYSDDAIYKFGFSYTDFAGNENKPIKYAEGTVAPEEFVVDNSVPTGTVSIDENTWDKFVSALTFGLWHPDTAKVSFTKFDKFSPIEIYQYYIADTTEHITAAELAKAEWTDIPDDNFYDEVSKDKTFVVYLRMVDYAGNESIISSDGYIVDQTVSAIELAYEDANDNGYTPISEDKDGKYFNIGYSVREAASYSGIKTIDYEVYNCGVKTQGGNLYTYNKNGDSKHLYEDLVPHATGMIRIDAEKNNSDNVLFVIKTVDNAGNENSESRFFKLDITNPYIEIKYDNNVALNEKYFVGKRTATIKLTERASEFDSVKATENILITAVNSSNESVAIDRDTMISSWQSFSFDDANKDYHVATITYSADANYTFSFAYTDYAGNTNAPISYASNTVAAEKFTLDNTNPVASVKISKTEWQNVWNTFFEILTFGLWDNEKVTISAEAFDATSNFKVEYFKTDRTSGYSAEELDALAVKNWKPYTELVVGADERFTVYIKVTDWAGNYIYVNTDGYIYDDSSAFLEITPEKPNDNGLYNGNVNVSINVNDKVHKNNDYYSGINSVEYWVECDGKETQREVIYKFDKQNPDFADLKREFSEVITIQAENNNSCDVKLYVRVVDNAGNVTTDNISLDIDITAPVIDIKYDNNDAYKVDGNRGYFPKTRTATISITERTHHFDEAAATEGIIITAVDAKGNPVDIELDDMLGEWITYDGETADEATHVMTIRYYDDANYTFAISYTDKADNVSGKNLIGDSVGAYEFTIDKVAPIGTITADGFGTWDRLLNVLTFGIWTSETVKITGTSNDITSPIESVDYYKTSDSSALTVQDLVAIQDESWNTFNGFEVEANEQFTVYLRIVDYAGNITFISSDGVIVDDSAPAIESIAPEVTIRPVQPVNDIYNTNVDVDITVVDPKNGNAYSGLKQIKYEVVSLGKVTQEGELYKFEIKAPAQSKLLQKWEGRITVDKNLNNSNDVVIKVYAVDNSNNSAFNTESIKIDCTRPKVDVSYSNNKSDSKFDTFFKDNRTATIKITERNFDPENVVIKMTNSDGETPVLSSWKKTKGSGNGDNTVYTATLNFKKDGDYTFSVTYTDQAGNKVKEVNYGDSVAPKKFTIDKTQPTFNVKYDNNSAQNGNYYKNHRIATITVKEHNFDTSRAVIKLTATNAGKTISRPSVSKWITNGDIHTATIRYSADAMYIFDFDYTDKAGNKSRGIDTQTFYVDTTSPVLSISGVVDNSANNTEEDVGIKIVATDTNFGSFAPVITGVIREGNKLVTKTFDIGRSSNVSSGRAYTVKNFEVDGIYRVKCTVVDKAGNAFTQVILENADKSTKTVKRAGNDTLITFSVNRDGSVFELNEETRKLVDNYYVQNVEDDLTVFETNANKLESYEVTLNGVVLKEGVDYSVVPSEDNSSWRRYKYTIVKSLFANEGEYNVVISSKDEAGNNAFSDVKSVSIAFIVDRTAPIITVSGMADKARYQVDKQLVTVIPVDDGGKLHSILIRLVDENGKEIKKLIEYAGEKLAKALEEGDGKLTFEINEGLYQNVQIVCYDSASSANDDNGNVYDYTFKEVSVSSSAVKILWASKGLRYGVFAGIGVLFIGIIIILIKRKKKDENS